MLGHNFVQAIPNLPVLVKVLMHNFPSNVSTEN